MFSLAAHEFAHGYAALKQGDTTALEQGRLTLNPLVHIDPWFTILMPALLWFGSGGQFTFGGAKPVQVRPDRYRNFRRGDIIVSSAGVLTNFAIALVCGGAFILLGLAARAFPPAAEIVGVTQRMATWGVWLNLMLGVFNLIPIPPLDGSHILYHFLPRGWREGYRRFQRFGFLPLLALMIFYKPGIVMLLTPAILALELFVRMASPFAASPGWNIFAS
ncbi:MAG TPA: site-2 protease family protein [Gemmatimonadales bacterium]|nr:site-2 protease family protein [Gemmatimonadales bacterium]